VLFLKSLFCLTGSDNRFRFIAIQLTCYFLFVITSSLFSFSSLLSFFSLFLFIGISSFSTKRRLNDANFNFKLLLAASGSFSLAGLIIILTNSNVSYGLLLFPISISSLLMTYKSKNCNHTFGYYGDIDLSGYTKQENAQNIMRIEPTFSQSDIGQSKGSEHQNASNDAELNNEASLHSNLESENDLGEVTRINLLNNKNAVLALSALVLVTIIGITLSLEPSTIDDENSSPANHEIVSKSEFKQTLLHEVTLPDNFTLFTSTFDGITIKWQGDASTEGFLWQQKTAQGDKSCMLITYNNGEEIRTLSVTQENDSDYLAHFSPLDTKTLIKNIANRSSFSLCGYKFSLKGSQSILGKHSYYSDFIAN